jgi:hypothetical protein
MACATVLPRLPSTNIELAAVKTAMAAGNDMAASLESRGNPRKAVDLNPFLVKARRNLVLVLADQAAPTKSPSPGRRHPSHRPSA